MKQQNLLSKTVILLTLFFFAALNSYRLNAFKKEMKIAAVGDCLITWQVSHIRDPRFLNLVELLRGADCAYGNCETTFFDAGKGFPAWKTMDPNQFCQPWGADELKWMGIDLVSLANNHTMDFDYDGLFSTLDNLDRVGIRYAGAGKDLDHASQPGYVETAAGPVALVSCTAWLPEINFQASLSHPHMKGRPGTNPLNTEFTVQVDLKTFALLKEARDNILEDLGVNEPRKDIKEIDTLDYMLMTFIKSDHTEILVKPDEKDLERIYSSIKTAKRNSRIVIVTIHEHNGDYRNKKPVKYQADFSRKCIEAGADLFICTGPHELWGLEIYQGKPIFHSLGNFFFQISRLISPEAYQRHGFPVYSQDPSMLVNKFVAEYFKSETIWESVVPIIVFDSENKLKEIALYPIFLDTNVPIYRSGIPYLAEGERARSIIEGLKEVSKPYNTKILFKQGVGKVTL
jgi:poly-gamma-glutamate capsule biosynthesis protein CapA/YwtB (metallophosphatase superfamily)